MNWPRLRWWLRIIYAISVVAILCWIVRGFFQGESSSAVDLFNPRALVFALAWLAMALWIGLLWALAIRVLTGQSLGWRTVVAVQGWAWAGRYLPAKAGLLAGKLDVVDGRRLTVRVVTVSVLFEQLAFLLTGLLAVAIVGDNQQQIQQMLEQVGAGALGQVWPPVLALSALAALSILCWGAARASGTQTPSGRAVALLMAVALAHLGSHLLCGIGLYVFVTSAAPAIAADLPWSIAALAWANVAGIVAIFAPSGLGVREWVLAHLLSSPAIGFDAALVLATALRVLSTAADVVLLLLAIAIVRTRRVAAC